MMRSGTAPVIFLINNRGYAIEILIHDGPYNRIQNWDYVVSAAPCPLSLAVTDLVHDSDDADCHV